MGPLIQLDNLTLAAFPPMSKEEAKGNVRSWHRDRWSHFPTGFYERPLAMNAICYLQDLTDENGPLRVIAGSHGQPISVSEAERELPHPDEKLIYPKQVMSYSPIMA